MSRLHSTFRGSCEMPLLLQTQAEPLPGYRLLEPLGKGGFGEVWKCEAPGGIHKAVKFVRNKSDGLNAEGADAQLELQALEYLRSVRHPFLLSMDRIEVIDGVLIVVMELADESLYDQLRHYQSVGQAGIPREALLDRLREAAEVLDLMNLSRRLLHLDVKPHNLLLLGGHVKVADFGLVSRLPRSPAAGADLPARRRQPGLCLAGSLQGRTEPVQRSVQPRRFLSRIADRRVAVRRQESPADGDAARPRRAGLEPIAASRSGGRRPRPLQRSRKALFVLHGFRRASGRGAGIRGLTPPARRPSPYPIRSRPIRRPHRPWTPPRRTPTATTSFPAALLGRCQFEECVSRGETTEVWTAATMEGEKCYVKFFHGLAEIDADARRDGLHLLESIRHPGLLPYNLVRDDGGRLIVVVPRKGPTLRERWAALPCRGPARPAARRIARRSQERRSHPGRAQQPQRRAAPRPKPGRRAAG